MSVNPLKVKPPPGLTGRSSATILGLFDGTAPAIGTPRSVPVAHDDSEMLGIWGELLDGFLDRGAARRFQRYAVGHAGYRWKPSLALVLPAEFSLDRPCHRRDLSVALEV